MEWLIVDAVAWLHRVVSTRQAAHGLLAEAAELDEVPIGRASGLCRVRGRVRIVRAVRAPTGQQVAAWQCPARGIVDGAYALDRDSGEFCVEDATGRVIVLGELELAGGDAKLVVLEEGDHVEVVGLVGRVRSTAGYRDAVPSLVIEPHGPQGVSIAHTW